MLKRIQMLHIQLVLHIHGSYIPDSTNHGLKVLGKKIPEISKKGNSNLLYAGHYLHCIYITFATIYITLTLY